METLVLPSQDQLSQHQYWHKHGSIMDIFASPRYSKHADLCSPARSIHRTNSALDFSPSSPSPSPSPVPLSRSSSDAARAASASGRVIHRKGSPLKNIKGSGKGGGGNNNSNKSSKGRENTAATVPVPPKTRAKTGFVKKEVKKEESPPKITILQRPASKEEAMLDLAKITGLPLSEVYAKNGLSAPEHAAGNAVKVFAKNRQFDGVAKAKPAKVAAAATTTQIVEKKKVVLDSKKDENQREEKVAVAVVPKGEAKERVAKRKGGVKPATATVDSTSTTTTTMRARTSSATAMLKAVMNSGSINSSNNTSSKSDGGPFARNFGEAFLPPPMFDEKWAGPAFTNSPPPSSLPIPNFSVRRPEMQAEFDFARMMDTEAATRGLRRILNLDF